MATIVCTYCGEDRPHSDEHIVQKGLGGNLTFKNVCKPCNEGFSTIDQALTDNSMVALARLVETPASKQVARATTELIYDPELDLWKEVRVSNRLTAEILPQLHYRGGGRVVVTATTSAPLKGFVAALEARVSRGDIEKERIKVDESCGTARIALRRQDHFVVRAPTLESGQELLKLLHEHWPKVKETFNTPPHPGIIMNPLFRGNLRVDINANFRAVAKIAFNYLAYRRGEAYARLPAFTDIREYIRGNNLVMPEPDGKTLDIDGRYVRFAPYGKLNLLGTKTHTVLLTRLFGGLLGGIVTLYEKHTFIVALGSVSRDFDPLAHEFSTDGTWNRELSLRDIVTRHRAASAADVDEQAVDEQAVDEQAVDEQVEDEQAEDTD